jgi:hypothetical protein
MNALTLGRRGRRRAARLIAPLVVLLAVTGCLDKPKITDRWTRIDLLAANVSPGQLIQPGARESLSVSTNIIYRSILTGFAVADLRVSGTLGPGSVNVSPDAPREQMAYDIDAVLANSVSVGRATRAVTGWDHLMQRLDLSFAGDVPAMMPPGPAPAGAPTGVFLLVYLGSGQKIERIDGSDTLIVTPFKAAQYQVLPIGVTLALPASVTAENTR